MKYLPVLILTALLSCHAPEQPPTKTTDPIPGDTAFNKSGYSILLSKFQPISFDTLLVYSPVDNLPELLQGNAIDDSLLRLLPAEISASHEAGEEDFFAIGQFNITEELIGLLARTPALYASTSFKLFFFDQAKDSITGYTELADIFGDAGDFMDKRSWIYRDSLQKPAAYIYINEGHDLSVDDRTDTTVDVFNYFYILNLAVPTADTISKDSSVLAPQLTTFEKIKR